MTDWFERLFGFKEGDEKYNKSQLLVKGDKLYSRANRAAYTVGEFSTPSLHELRRLGKQVLERGDLDACGMRGSPVVTAEFGDVGELHRQKPSRHATFQVASQLNCLEFADQDVTPEDGVTRYADDKTQGPACAVACGAGTVYRNYFAQVMDEGGKVLREGQSQRHQIECLAGLLADLGLSDVPGFAVKGGYTLADDAGLEAINRKLAGLDGEDRDRLRARLRVGVQAGVEVTGHSWGSVLIGDPGQVVTQVFCSACSVAYSRNPALLWEPLARLVLEASYEAVLWVALITAAFHRGASGSRRVFLTALGSGVFGNDMSWVTEAMRRAIERVCVESGVALEVLILCDKPPVHQLLHELTKCYSRESARRSTRRATPTFHIIEQLNRVIHSGRRSLRGRPVSDVWSLFDALDSDHNGALDRAEIKKGFERLGVGVGPEQIDGFLQMLDDDGNGRVDFQELERGLLHPELLWRRAARQASPVGSPASRPPSRRGLDRSYGSVSQGMASTLGAGEDAGLSNRAAAFLSIVRHLNEVIRSGRRTLYGEHVRDVSSFFAALDWDYSGALEPAKIAAGFERLDVAVRAEDIADFLALLDADGDGLIRPAELARGLGAPDQLLLERPGGLRSPAASSRRGAAGPGVEPAGEPEGPRHGERLARWLGAPEARRLGQAHRVLRDACGAGSEFKALLRRVAWGRSAMSAPELVRACREHLKVQQDVLPDEDIELLHRALDMDERGSVDPARLEDFLVLEGDQALLRLAQARGIDPPRGLQSETPGARLGAGDPPLEPARPPAALGTGLSDVQDRAARCVLEAEAQEREEEKRALQSEPAAGAVPPPRAAAGYSGGWADEAAAAADSPAAAVVGSAAPDVLESMHGLFEDVHQRIEEYRSRPTQSLLQPLVKALEDISGILVEVERQAVGAADRSLVDTQRQLRRQRELQQESVQKRQAGNAYIVAQLQETICSGRRTMRGKRVRDARSFFEALDRNGNGVLERSEIADGFRRLDVAVSPDDLAWFLHQLNGNSDGLIDQAELERGLQLGAWRSSRPASAPRRGPRHTASPPPRQAGRPTRARSSSLGADANRAGAGDLAVAGTAAGGASPPSWAPLGGAALGRVLRGPAAPRAGTTPVAQPGVLSQRQAQERRPAYQGPPPSAGGGALHGPRVAPRRGAGPAKAQPLALEGASAVLQGRASRPRSAAAELAAGRPRPRRPSSAAGAGASDLERLLREAYPGEEPEDLLRLQGAWGATPAEAAPSAEGSPCRPARSVWRPLSPRRTGIAG